MLLINVRIRNFRTISEELAFQVNHSTALIGPNNTGKTNILRSIHLFFCLHPYSTSIQYQNYSRLDDFPKFVDSGRTTIQMIFKGQNTDADNEILTLYDDIKGILRIPVITKSTALDIHLTMSDTDRPTYQIFPGKPLPKSVEELKQYHDVEDLFFEKFFGNFAVHYIQSDKRFVEIYDTLLLPSLKQALSENLSSVYETVKSGIRAVNDQLNKYMTELGLSLFQIRLTPPDDVADLIKDIHFRLEDEIESELSSKGMGIQALAMMSSIVWLQELYHRNQVSVVWLIEEPESFLHPSLLTFQKKILGRLSKHATVIYATHALGLIPYDPKAIVGIEKEEKRSIKREFKNNNDATRQLRSLLGVRFGDFYDLPEVTIAVEGASDRDSLEWFLRVYSADVAPTEHQWPLLRDATVLDYGGVEPLRFFIQSNYEFIHAERPYVALFDADDAGTRARHALQSYFQGKKIGYASGIDFISLRQGYSIEGVFADQVLKEMCEEDDTIFIGGLSLDIEGRVAPFRIHEHRKRDALHKLMRASERTEGFAWAERFILLCTALDLALSRQHERLQKMEPGSPMPRQETASFVTSRAGIRLEEGTVGRAGAQARLETAEEDIAIKVQH
jgi:hypothetical protein